MALVPSALLSHSCHFFACGVSPASIIPFCYCNSFVIGGSRSFLAGDSSQPFLRNHLRAVPVAGHVLLSKRSRKRQSLRTTNVVWFLQIILVAVFERRPLEVIHCVRTLATTMLLLFSGMATSVYSPGECACLGRR